MLSYSTGLLVFKAPREESQPCFSATSGLGNFTAVSRTVFWWALWGTDNFSFL